ncbi:MAG: 30S ribosomal protein S2 [Parvularculales bacterium]
MALPDFTMRQLLEVGAHFGHQKHRWNPRMAPYLFGVRNNIHIIDLSQTVPLLHQALVAVRDVVAGGGRLLMVGTKRVASQPVMGAAKQSAQYYINHHWLGGTLTNWQTITNSIKRLVELEGILEKTSESGLTKKELLNLTRERDRLERALGGIRDMGGVPDMIFIIDTNKEEIAVKEAQKLGIPIVAILDSNSNSDGIAYPIPGNDDASRAVGLYCDLIARAAIDGLSMNQSVLGEDPGSAEDPIVESLPSDEGSQSPAMPQVAEISGSITPATAEQGKG